MEVRNTYNTSTGTKTFSALVIWLRGYGYYISFILIILMIAALVALWLNVNMSAGDAIDKLSLFNKGLTIIKYVAIPVFTLFIFSCIARFTRMFQVYDSEDDFNE